VRDASPTTPSTVDEPVHVHGARAPQRSRRVESAGISLAVHEWGDEAAPPLLFAHGGFDFARTLDVFAPLLADAGWRVVCWDQRGHGDSEHASLYSWDADLRDMLAVLDDTSHAPLPVIGQSKGGGLAMNLVHALPERFTRYEDRIQLPLIAAILCFIAEALLSERARSRREWQGRFV
jgi:pimeloyl-ACP methyl ester carboxylesterase